MRSKSKQIFSLLVLLTILILPQLFLPSRNIGSNSIDNENKINKHRPYSITNSNPKESETKYINNKYNLSDWWNATFRYRICIELEENHSVARYQPIEVYLTFQENEHYINSTRLVSYNATGNNEWSQPITIQIWNITKYYLTNYIQTCTITFIANVSANSNQIYFLYYNNNMVGIDIPYYNTDFSSVLTNGKLNVSIGQSESKFEVLIEENYGISKLEKDGINFHIKDSLAPEKQLSDSSIELLLHCDDGSGDLIRDSSNNEFIGELIGNTKWTNGRLDNCTEFDGNGDYISFDDILNFPFGSTSKEFTITAWIKPKMLSSYESNHGIMNCFMAKASEPYNDNLELGIYRYNETHGYLQVYIETVLKNNISSIYGNITNNPILINEWNFVAVRYFEGDVDVQINNIIYNKDIYNNESWSGSKYLDQASGSFFTLGATIDGNIFYNGTLDEIVIYNCSLSNNDINQFKLAKNKSSIESIIELENGKVFSRYKILWKQIFDMHIEDIITFYYDYNLWNIYRCIYFDNKFCPEKASMNALNTYYNFSEIYNQKDGKYFYDGIVSNDLTSSGFIVENYSIIYTPNPFNISLGIFIAEYEVSEILDCSINELKGNVAYYNNITEFSPGSITDFDNNNGGSNFKLYIDFWEFIDKLNQSGTLNDNDLVKYFNNTLSTLRNPINIYVYHQESLFFKFIVHIEDIDNNPVNHAMVSIYNLTVDGDIDQLIFDQNTNLAGNTTFLYLKNGTYTVNVTYMKYGQPAFQIIKQPINITINETKADKYGRVFHSFYNVSLTSVEMEVKRIDPDTHQIKELAVNANVSFWINDGSGNKYLGYELTDSSGIARFQWRNFSSSNNGNITFAIFWYDTLINISCEDDDIIFPKYPTNITLYFYKEIIITVNLSSYRFSTALVESIPESVYIGEEITFQVNYSYTINYTNPIPIEEASVYYYIQHENVNISSRLIQFNETAVKGTYLTKFNTSKPEDPCLNLLGGNTYIMAVHASKPGYIPITTTILFELLLINSNLISKNNELEIFWNENFTIEVYYESLYQIPYTGINSANITFSVINFPTINGSLISNSTIGWYKLNLNSSIFKDIGLYNMVIKACKKNYNEMNINFMINILPRRFLVNDKFIWNEELYKFYIGDESNFTFSLKDYLTNEIIYNLDNYSYTWKNYDFNGNFLEGGQKILIKNNSNNYILDFDTEKRSDGIYQISIFFSKSKYLNISINYVFYFYKRGLIPSLDDAFKNGETSVMKGKTLLIELYLKDFININTGLTGAIVEIKYGGKVYKFEEIGKGYYTYKFETDNYDTLFIAENVLARIYISKVNYESEIIDIEITINREEIVPGIPLIYFILIILSIPIIIGLIFINKLLKKKIIRNILSKLKTQFKKLKIRLLQKL